MYTNELGNLKSSKKEINDKIDKTDIETKFLQNTTQDDQNKVVDPNTYEKID